MKPKYFLFDVVGAVLLLVGIMWFLSTTDNKIFTIIVSAIGLSLILFGEYLRGQSKSNSSLDSQHYDTLISLYKYTGLIITLLIGIAAWIIGSSLSETRDNISKDLMSLKNELKQMKSESESAINLVKLKSELAIKDEKSEAEKQMVHLRENTKMFLDLTKDITARQIETIGIDARSLALSTARDKVEEAFKTPDIQYEIDRVIKDEIGTKLDQRVQQHFEKLNSVFEELPSVTNLIQQIYLGNRYALDIMDSLANFSDHPTIKNITEKYLIIKGRDYELAVKGLPPYEYRQPTKSLVNFDSLFTKTDSLNAEKKLVNTILNDKDLFKVTVAFLDLKKLLNIDIRTFDLNAIRKIKNELGL